MALMKICRLRKPRAVYFTHWILALSNSLPALGRCMLNRPAKFNLNPLALRLWIQHGDMLPDEFLARVAHQRLCGWIGIGHDPCGRIKRQLAILRVGPAQGIQDCRSSALGSQAIRINLPYLTGIQHL